MTVVLIVALSCSAADFALRVAVACLRTLDRELPPPDHLEQHGEGDDDKQYRAHLLQLLETSLATAARLTGL